MHGEPRAIRLPPTAALVSPDYLAILYRELEDACNILNYARCLITPNRAVSADHILTEQHGGIITGNGLLRSPRPQKGNS